MDIFKTLHGTDNALIIARRDDLILFATTYADRVIAGQAKTPVRQEVEKPISQQDAIIFLDKSRQTLIAWRKKGIIKGYRLGGRIYYKTSELVSALENLS